MTAVRMARPVVLVPPEVQTLWGRPAVINFVCGGFGTGLYVLAAVAAGFRPSPVLRIASWLGPGLVLAGFLAVASEAGRPLRGALGLVRVRTSWMSREMWLGGAFVLFAAGEFGVPVPGHAWLAATAAVTLALAQGFILRQAPGVAAWTSPVMPLVFLTSALVSGSGLLTLIELARGEDPGSRLLGGMLALLVLYVVAWWAFITWSEDAAFIQSVRPLRGGRGALAIMGVGYIAPSLLAALAITLPELAAPLAALAAALAIAGQIQMKTALISKAGQLRPITLAHDPHERRAR